MRLKECHFPKAATCSRFSDLGCLNKPRGLTLVLERKRWTMVRHWRDCFKSFLCWRTTTLQSSCDFSGHRAHSHACGGECLCLSEIWGRAGGGLVWDLYEDLFTEELPQSSRFLIRRKDEYYLHTLLARIPWLLPMVIQLTREILLHVHVVFILRPKFTPVYQSTMIVPCGYGTVRDDAC